MSSKESAEVGFETNWVKILLSANQRARLSHHFETDRRQNCL